MSLPGQRDRYTVRLFAIAGIPLSISPWYAALALVVVLRASSFGVGVLALLAATISVLVHELGHAFAARRYRLRPHVVIHGLGGYCERLPSRTSDQDLVVVAAGPAVGLVVGAIAWVAVTVWPSAPWWYAAFFGNLALMGIFWSLVNLLPMQPLDGGRLFELLFGSRTFDAAGWSYRIAMPLAAVLALVSLVLDQLFVGLLFAYIAAHNAFLFSDRGPGSYGPEWTWLPLRPLSTGLAIAIVVATGVASWYGAALVELDPTSVLAGQVWRFVSWPLATTPLQAAATAVGCALLGREVEQRWSWRLYAIVVVGLLAGGIAAFPLAWLLGGTVGGVGCIGLSVAAAWTALDPWALVDRRIPLVRVGVLALVTVVLLPVNGTVGSLLATLVAGAIGFGGVWGLHWLRLRREEALMRDPPVFDLSVRRRQDD